MNNSLTMELLHSTIENEGEYLEHHGIMGMKWGVRRYQNEDGSYTEAGRKRYGIGSEKKSKKHYKRMLNDLEEDAATALSGITKAKRVQHIAAKRLNKAMTKNNNKKIDKYARLGYEQAKVENVYREKLSDIESKQWKIIADAVKDKYNVTIKDAMIDTRPWLEKIVSGGAVGGALAAIEGDIVSGNKYKISKAKDGQGAKVIMKKKAK